MRNLRVSYGIYKPLPDQSDRSICYNYDLKLIYIPYNYVLEARMLHTVVCWPAWLTAYH